MAEKVVRNIQRTVLTFLGAFVLLGLVGVSVPNRFVEGFRVDHAGAVRIQMVRLEAALERFLLDHGRYPTTAEGLQALILDPGSGSWQGPYLFESGMAVDPWGRPYRYSSPGDRASYDLWSLGADGRPGGTRLAGDLHNR